MSTTVDATIFQDLVHADPASVLKRVQCDYDARRRCYHMTVWGVPYRICPAAGSIQPDPHGYLGLFMVHYLLSAVEVPPSGEWISVKDMPGGTTFFRGPHAVPVEMITARFGNDLAAFGNRCRQLGGQVLEMADKAFGFNITNGLPLAVLYWQGDDDFAPEAGLLFDRTLAGQLALDIIYALSVAVCTRLGRPETVA